jgi:hypothetical protein
VIGWGWEHDPAARVPPALSNVVAISAGYERSLVLKADGTVEEWGFLGGDVPRPADLRDVVAIAAGGRFSIALLRDGAPQMTVEPWDQFVTNGASASFSAKAVGEQSMSYQWQRNGADIPGATQDTLRLHQVTPAAAGAYSVQVKNSYGSSTSRDARLVVKTVLGNIPAGAGQNVSFLAARPEDAGKPLNFLLRNAPAGATINAKDGAFAWRPPVALAGTTQPFEVLVSDDASPAWSEIRTFDVVVAPLTPVTLSLSLREDGMMLPRVDGSAGPDYVLEHSLDLKSWQPLWTNTPATMPLKFAAGLERATPQGFYRMRLGP